MQYFLFKCTCFWLLTMAKLYGTSNSPSRTILLHVIVTLHPARPTQSHHTKTWGQCRGGSLHVCSLSLLGVNEEWWALLVLLWVRDYMSRMIWEVTGPCLSEGQSLQASTFYYCQKGAQECYTPLNRIAQQSWSAPNKLDCGNSVLKGQKCGWQTS